MPKDNRNITWNVDVTGTQAAATDFNTVNKSMEMMEMKSRAAATRFTGVASASAAMGTALAAVSPKVGGLASALGTAGGATSGLVTAIGGVGGLAAGGLVAALSVAIRWFVESKKEAKSLEDQLKDTKTEADNLAEALAEIQKKQAAAHLTGLLIGGLATQQQHQARVDTIIKERAEMAESLKDALKQNKSAKEINKLKDDLATKLQEQVRQEKFVTEALDDSNAALREHYDLIDKGEKKAAEAREKGATGGGRGGSRAADEESIDSLMGRAFKPSMVEQIANEINKKQEDALYESLDRRADAQIAAQERLAKDLMAIHRLQKAEEAGILAAKEEANDKYWDNLKAGAANYAKFSLETGTSTLQALVKGQEISGALILERFGDEMVAEGTRRLWEAAGMAFTLYGAPLAGPLAAIAAGEISAGLAMGAAGASMQRPSGKAASPEPTGQQSSSRDEGGAVVVNINALHADARVGQETVKALDAVKRKRGKSWEVGARR